MSIQKQYPISHLINVVVFPVKGLKRPIPDKISGSDLDGDIYFVSWDKSLIPKKGNEEPMIFPVDKSKTSDKIEFSDIVAFFIHFLEKDKLGKVANAHLAHYACSKLGVKDPKCLKLAYLHSLAVDFPKTGKFAELTEELIPKVYPQFMNRKGKSVRAECVLQKLYDDLNLLMKKSECTEKQHTEEKVAVENKEKKGKNRKDKKKKKRNKRDTKKRRNNKNKVKGKAKDNSLLDLDLLIEGRDSYTKEAHAVFLDFAFEFGLLLKNLSIEREADLFTFNISKYMKKRVKMKQIRENFNYLTEKYRRTFLTGVSSEEEKLKKASAWYEVCYQKKAKKKCSFLCFPWLVYDFVCKIKGDSKTNKKNLNE